MIRNLIRGQALAGVFSVLAVSLGASQAQAFGDAFDYFSVGGGAINNDLSSAYAANPASIAGGMEKKLYVGGTTSPGFFGGAYLGLKAISFQMGATYVVGSGAIGFGGSIAGYIPGADIGIGLGTTGYSHNVGLLFGKNRGFKLGLAVQNFVAASRTYLAGMGIEFGRFVVFSVDGSSSNFSSYRITPALLVGSQLLAGTIGYGLNVGGGGGLAGALNVGLSASIKAIGLRAYYSSGLFSAELLLNL